MEQPILTVPGKQIPCGKREGQTTQPFHAGIVAVHDRRTCALWCSAVITHGAQKRPGGPPAGMLCPAVLLLSTPTHSCTIPLKPLFWPWPLTIPHFRRDSGARLGGRDSSIMAMKRPIHNMQRDTAQVRGLELFRLLQTQTLPTSLPSFLVMLLLTLRLLALCSAWRRHSLP